MPRRLIAPLLLIVFIAIAWGIFPAGGLSWADLARRQAQLNAWVAAEPVLAACLFVVFYIATVTLSLPQAGLLTMTSGFLFGTAEGGALAVIGATIGAAFLFMIARSAFGDSLARRGGPTLGKLRGELRRDGFSYLLAIRLVPVVPFWVVNLAAALCGMRLRHFVAATAIGIMPATFVLASIGAGVGGELSKGETPNPRLLLTWPVLGPLLALAVLSVTPVIWRKWRTRHA
jgi:uncharacterized membrane protein YdjX (TVP38/TMEM64 family)